MEAVNSMRSLSTFNYVPTMRCESSRRHVLLSCRVEVTKGTGGPAKGTMTTLWEKMPNRPAKWPEVGWRTLQLRPHRTQLTLSTRPGSKRKNRPQGLQKELPRGGTLPSTPQLWSAHAVRSDEGHPMLRKPQLMTAAPKSHNAQKYCEFHELNSYTTAERRELKKALHELADKGGSRSLRKEHDLSCAEPREKECSTEIVATIASRYAEGITQAEWKAQMRGT
ncbi:hypothetical protein Cgig2_031554 [Carnegiea gigantea]|uniref:Uncharacterized protein n=1 Tax=Carnegiea gigantea TaxID=171969 RepID=A0A9Q1Q572_9CARY|nr:hypothetical protein Cgig2_031554 [Carnegiea gigantea]